MGIKIEKPRIQHWKPGESTLETRGFDNGIGESTLETRGFDNGIQGNQHWKLQELTLETTGKDIGNTGI